MMLVAFAFSTRTEWLLNSVENFIRFTRSFKDVASHGTRLVALEARKEKSIRRCLNFHNFRHESSRKFMRNRNSIIRLDLESVL